MIFYGRNVVIEALKSSKYSCKKIYLQEKIRVDSKIQSILDLSKKSKISVEYAQSKLLRKICNSDDNQGVLADIDYKVQLNFPQKFHKNDSFLYIYEATYEHNVGALARSSEVSGISGLIIPQDIKITPVSARSSAGAIFHLPVYKYELFSTIDYFRKNKFKIIGIERGDKHYFEENLSGNNLFIIGGEDKEIDVSLKSKCDVVVSIPQVGKINSLNMSVAASIILFERLKQIKES